jgi:tetratricopeptide (TPR) repeat protein
VAGEAQIRTGLIHISMANHAAALGAFEAAQPVASDRELKYLGHFLAGRSLEALKRPDEAIAQYQSALAVEPSAESAAVLLAALQFSHTDRDAAVRLIDKTFAAPRTTTDPGRLTGYGFYLRWPAIKAAMRAELVK